MVRTVLCLVTLRPVPRKILHVALALPFYGLINVFWSFAALEGPCKLCVSPARRGFGALNASLVRENIFRLRRLVEGRQKCN